MDHSGQNEVISYSLLVIGFGGIRINTYCFS